MRPPPSNPNGEPDREVCLMLLMLSLEFAACSLTGKPLTPNLSHIAAEKSVDIAVYQSLWPALMISDCFSLHDNLNLNVNLGAV